jgi:hypothetical protein
VTALDQRVQAAEAKFKAGEMTFDDFRKEERAVQTERRTLDDARIKGEISTEQTEQMAAARWKWETDRFFREATKNDGIDYKAKENRPLWAALDAEVRALGADEANASKPGTWFLEEAHRRIKTTFKLGSIATVVEDKGDKSAATRKAEAERAAAALRAKAKAKPAQTLQGLPEAGSEAPGEKGEFAHLENLTGMELETALARMPKEDADRYLSGA